MIRRAIDQSMFWMFAAPFLAVVAVLAREANVFTTPG